MKIPKISVIVPVYNVMQYLPRCINRILDQTFTDFELLLIDDGSTDNSGKICDEYADKDHRIRVFHKTNGGVSSARNLGLDNAKGEWITFSDSDDELYADALNNYNDIIQDYDNVDIICCGHSVCKKSGFVQNYTFPKFLLLEDKEKILLECENSGSCGFLWNKCFRTTIIRQGSFDESISWCEDHIFTYGILRYVKYVCFSPVLVYKYYFNDLERKGKGKGLSNKLLDYNMILKVAQLEYDVKNKLYKGDSHLLEIINKAYASKTELAFYYAIISGHVISAYGIYKKYIKHKTFYTIMKFVLSMYLGNYLYQLKVKNIKLLSV